MRHLKYFNLFKSSDGLTRRQKDFLDRFVSNWSYDQTTGLVSIPGDFNANVSSLSGPVIKSLEGIRFADVNGTFTLRDNEVVSLEGCPEVVGKDFNCSDNPIDDLKGGPRVVKGTYYCTGNQLKSLEGAPEVVGGEFITDYLRVPVGGWSVGNLVDLYIDSWGERERLLSTLVSPEVLQKKIDEAPERMAVLLKGVIKKIAAVPQYQDLKFPASLRQEVDLLSDLEGVGL